MHIHDQVAGKEFSRGLALLTFFDLRDAFGWDEHLIDNIAHLFGLDALLDIILDLVLLPGKHVDDKPLILRCECLSHNN